MTTETTKDIKELHPELHGDIETLFNTRATIKMLEESEAKVKERINRSLKELGTLFTRVTDKSTFWESGPYEVSISTTSYKPTYNSQKILDAISQLLEADVIEGIKEEAIQVRPDSEALKIAIPKKKDEK